MMALTILFAKVFGAYLIIAGLAILVRRKFFMSALGAFFEEKFARLVAAAIEVIGGLLVINLHNDWSSLAAGLISLFGWLMLAKGLVIFFASDESAEKFIRNFNKRKWYMIDGAAALLLGLYLAGFGYSWF